MYVKWIGLFLLTWFPGQLKAQRPAQDCQAPPLENGYMIPAQESYKHNTHVNYACDEGRKTVAGVWWATITCKNGRWTDTPLCIDEKACSAPVISNGEYTESSTGWYDENYIIRVTCTEGYKHRDNHATAKCVNGLWVSLPVCEMSNGACLEPPKIPHAVIINSSHQGVYPNDSELQFECADGFTVQGANVKKSIICLGGQWTGAPPCSRKPGGSGEAIATTTRGTDSGPVPTPESNRRERHITEIRRCGRIPRITNSEVVERGKMFLEYQCIDYYKHIGPEKVVCYSDGMWSTLPACIENFCTVDRKQFPALKLDGVQFLRNGETEEFECVTKKKWWNTHYASAECRDGRVRLGKCCSGWDEFVRRC